MDATGRIRLDAALVMRGLAPSRSRARDMVRRGAVTVDGARETRPARLVAPATALVVDDPAAPYVSRAALKLGAALDRFGFDPGGLSALDLGASAGGFTQVLLERGAACVLAVDVGHGEMDAGLAADPRVILLEGVNARDLSAARLGGRKVEAIVADLSFISLKQALPAALSLAEPAAWGVFLVKPQFEVGRAGVGKGGIVRDAALARAAPDAVAAWLRDEAGWTIAGIEPSPIVGGSGNVEYLLAARRG